MNRKLKIAAFLLVLFGMVSIGLVLGFKDHIAVLNSGGLIGEKQQRLLLIATLLMLIVVIPVFALTFFISWKYRSDNKRAVYSPDWDYNKWVEALWWGVPCLIVIALGIINWRACHELDPFRPLDSKVEPIRIQAVALQWKWLFIYPDEGIATVNFVQFPEKTPINFEITADAPMNSFWIPQLGGQVYAMAGMKSKLHLLANQIDSYRGCSANISGKGFSGMVFEAKSSSKEAFEEWVQSVKDSSDTLGSDQYLELKEPSEYHPKAFYVLSEQDLFEEIVMKYMPGKHDGSHL